MTLPKVEVPTYELTLPSQDIKVKYRPFLVKEEKILLIAAETGGQKELVQVGFTHLAYLPVRMLDDLQE